METRKEPRWQGMPACRIIRPFGHSPLVVRPIDPFPLVVVVHRMSGRTLPCDGKGCLFCHHCVPDEERLFWRVLQSEKRGLAVLDLPPTQWRPLVALHQSHGPLHRAILSLSRPGGKPTSRIALEILSVGLSSCESSGVPELESLLEQIFAKNRHDATQALRFGKTTL